MHAFGGVGGWLVRGFLSAALRMRGGALAEDPRSSSSNKAVWLSARELECCRVQSEQFYVGSDKFYFRDPLTGHWCIGVIPGTPGDF